MSERRPDAGAMLCLVSDRRRVKAVIPQIEEAAGAGIDLVQIREPDLPANELLDLVSRAVAAVRGTRTRVIVNDRLDVALAAGAHGVHLRGTSVDAARVRAVVKSAPESAAGFLVGRSVHSVEEATRVEAEGGLDYLILGTMFPTVSKPGTQTPAGPEVLREAARACKLPILAIGGITLENVPEIARTGAAGIAAIGLFVPAQAMLSSVAAEIRRAFAAAAPKSSGS